MYLYIYLYIYVRLSLGAPRAAPWAPFGRPRAPFGRVMVPLGRLRLLKTHLPKCHLPKQHLPKQHLPKCNSPTGILPQWSLPKRRSLHCSSGPELLEASAGPPRSLRKPPRLQTFAGGTGTPGCKQTSCLSSSQISRQSRNLRNLQETIGGVRGRGRRS